MSRPIPTRAPRLLVALAVMGAMLFAVPVVALFSRAPLSRLTELLAAPVVLDALRLSIFTSTLATILSLILGVPLAWVLARVSFPGREVVRALVTLPMVLPPVVGGAALLFAFGRRGLVGQQIYETTGLTLPFSTAGVVVANTFVAMPFLVVTVYGALTTIAPGPEQAAATLGATPLMVFRRVTLPLIGPSLRAGAVLAWARALGEFGATVTFAGNLQGRTQTLPLAVFVALGSDREAAVAISLLMVVVSLTVLLTLRHRWWNS